MVARVSRPGSEPNVLFARSIERAPRISRVMRSMTFADESLISREMRKLVNAVTVYISVSIANNEMRENSETYTTTSMREKPFLWRGALVMSVIKEICYVGLCKFCACCVASFG